MSEQVASTTTLTSTSTPTITSSFADLRACSTDSHRFRSRAAKYDSFQHVHAGQLGAPQYQPIPHEQALGLNRYPANLADAPIATLGKRDLWTEARWAASPTHHRSYRKDKRGNTPKYERRREEIRTRWAAPEVEVEGADPQVLAERDVRDEELRRIENEDYDDGQGEEVVRRVDASKGSYDVLVEEAQHWWEEKRTRAAEKAGWEVVSEVASVQSDETETEQDKDGTESDYELV